MTGAPVSIVQLYCTITASNGPDRSIDATIARYLWRGATPADIAGGRISLRDPAPYTDNFEAALLFVPAGWLVTHVGQMTDADTGAPMCWSAGLNIEGDAARSYRWHASAATPALALCAACALAHFTLTDGMPV